MLNLNSFSLYSISKGYTSLLNFKIRFFITILLVYLIKTRNPGTKPYYLK